MHDKWVTNADNIDTSGFVLKTKYDTNKSDLEKKISDADKKILDTSGIVKKTDYDAKITEIKGKIPSIIGLATTTTLTAVENKIPDVSNLVQKKDYDAEILDMKSKYFTTADYNRFTNQKVSFWRWWYSELFSISVNRQIFKKKMLILIIFQNGNLKDYLIKVLKLLLHLIIVFL